MKAEVDVFFFQAEDGIRDTSVTGVQTCALPILVLDDTLLPAFANSFNAAHHTTASGARIEVRPVLANSGVIKDQLINRFTLGGRIGRSEERRIGKECRARWWRRK